LLQYGYGSYGDTIYPEFDETVLSLLDRGFIYAIAHIRGG
jgi:oligopeptidase B